MAILSLEPLSEALASIETAEAEKRQHGNLASKLQQLWQEQGDFSQLTLASLQEKVVKEEEESKAINEEQLLPEASTSAAASSTQEGQADQEETDTVSEQTLSPEQLWELKSNILEGLNLARVDITAALDLLQLYLNPLNALNPPVPDEALALPASSFTATSLHTPLLPPTENNLLTDTGLSLSTKLKAVDTASDVFRNASKRLERTIEQSQSDWTDLLRLKRAGEWKMQARGVPASHQQASNNPYDLNAQIQFERFAKDICIICGTDEATPQWRHAGMVRLKDRKGKGKEVEARDRLEIPERIEGRRTLVLKLKLFGLGEPEEAISFYPAVDAETANGANLAPTFLQTQKELFEEEIFAEIVQEARESLYDIKATRESISASKSDALNLTVQMETLDDVANRQPNRVSPALQTLVSILSAVCRLQMIQIYKQRRQDLQPPQPKPSNPPSNSTVSKPPREILPTLLRITSYYIFTSSIRRLLHTAKTSMASLGIFSEDETDLSLDFAVFLDSSDDLIAALESNDLRFGGCSTLAIGEHSIHLTFTTTGTLCLHLKNKEISLTSLDQLAFVLQPAIRAAVLEHCRNTLCSLLKEKSDGWDIMPLPDIIEKSTQVLARRRIKGTVSDFLYVPLSALSRQRLTSDNQDHSSPSQPAERGQPSLFCQTGVRLCLKKSGITLQKDIYKRSQHWTIGGKEDIAFEMDHRVGTGLIYSGDRLGKVQGSSTLDHCYNLEHVAVYRIQRKRVRRGLWLILKACLPWRVFTASPRIACAQKEELATSVRDKASYTCIYEIYAFY